MERKLVAGDYVPDGKGGLLGLTGSEALLQRVLFRLTARRGAHPFLPALGSRLHLLLREKPSARQALCAQYVVQALEEERDVKVTAVELSPRGEGGLDLTVRLDWQGEGLSVSLTLGEEEEV